MTDREKVIKGLECCIPMTTRGGLADCKKCPYDRKITLEGGIIECCHDVMTDALALLKAQEPVEPKLIGIYYVCGQCGMRTVGQRKAQTNDMLKVSNYCPDCGRAVKWE